MASAAQKPIKVKLSGAQVAALQASVIGDPSMADSDEPNDTMMRKVWRGGRYLEFTPDQAERVHDWFVEALNSEDAMAEDKSRNKEDRRAARGARRALSSVSDKVFKHRPDVIAERAQKSKGTRRPGLAEIMRGEPGVDDQDPAEQALRLSEAKKKPFTVNGLPLEHSEDRPKKHDFGPTKGEQMETQRHTRGFTEAGKKALSGARSEQLRHALMSKLSSSLRNSDDIPYITDKINDRFRRDGDWTGVTEDQVARVMKTLSWAEKRQSIPDYLAGQEKKSEAAAVRKSKNAAQRLQGAEKRKKQFVQAGQKSLKEVKAGRGLKRGKRGGMYYETKSGRKVYVK